MPIGTGDIPKALLTAMRTEFLKALDEQPADKSWQDFTMTVPSTTDTETYGWLGQLPSMREFVGERIVRDLTESGKTLKNKTWEMTVGVQRSAWEDDKVGSIKLKVQGMAELYNNWLSEQAYRCLLLGHLTDATNPYGEAYDDAAFNASTHSIGTTGANIDNLNTTALAAAGLKTELGIMMGYRGDQNRYLGVMPTHLVVSPKLLITAREIVTPIGGATSGQAWWGMFKVLCHPCWAYDDLAGTGGNTQDWALVDCSKPTKPIIFQQRTELEFTSLTADSDTGFMRDEWLFGVRVRCAFGYGAYWLSNLSQTA